MHPSRQQHPSVRKQGCDGECGEAAAGASEYGDDDCCVKHCQQQRDDVPSDYPSSHERPDRAASSIQETNVMAFTIGKIGSGDMICLSKSPQRQASRV